MITSSLNLNLWQGVLPARVKLSIISLSYDRNSTLERRGLKIFNYLMAQLNKYLSLISLVTLTMFLTNCSTFNPIVKVEVPKGYIGWCYVIPVDDTLGISFEINNDKYKISDGGIVYIPAATLKLKEDNVVKVYENGVDISDAMRYAGNVHKVTKEGKKYNYIKFYLPSLEERAIADYDQYWRDKKYEYNQKENKRFDSLLKSNVIVFK